MFAKVLILALALGANAQLITKSVYGAGLGLTGGVPVYRSSANYGGLVAANGWGYGANLGRVAGIGALRTTGGIIGGGALGYGTGGLIAGGYHGGLVAPAVSTIGLGGVGLGGVGAYGLGAVGHGLANLNIARGISVHQAGPVNAAVQTLSRTVDYRPVPYVGEPPVVQDVDVPPQESPLRINFQSKSSPLQISQGHIPAPPQQVQVTQSEDEPQTAIHNVHRPVVQQVNEVVQPYRTLTQVVEPVIEQTHTNIAQGEGVRLSGLETGVVGGSGVIGATGLGIASGVVGVGGVRSLGLANAGLYGNGLVGGYGVRSGLVGSGLVGGYGLRSGLIGNGLVGGYGVRSGLIGGGLGYGYGLNGLSGLGYGSGIVRSGLVGSGLGYGYGLNGLSGLSTYGTTAKIARVL